MKKTLSLLLVLTLLLSAVSALALPSAAGYTDTPELVITEVCNDTVGDGTVIPSYNAGSDAFEYIEIYNPSKVTVNLYDYAMTYNSKTRSNADFEKSVVEMTPIKAGDWKDGSTYPYPNTKNPCGDMSAIQNNPDECFVAPGEIVLLWVVFYESFYAKFNDGKGFGQADFRKFHNVPDDVKVIVVDGTNFKDDAEFGNYGGHDKNFNVKNSAVGTYGICKISAELSEQANTAGSTYPCGDYTEFADFACWCTNDFDGQIIQYGASTGNLVTNYVPDTSYYAAKEFGLPQDTRRMMLLETLVPTSAGKLTPLQKMWFGLPLEAGESVDLASFVPASVNVYKPSLTDLGKMEGLIINGTLYGFGTKFVAETAGTYTLEYKFEKDGKTPTASVTTKTPETTQKPETTKKPVTTKAPVTTTAATPETTNAPAATTQTEEKKSGCGSSVALGAVVIVMAAGYALKKKKED